MKKILTCILLFCLAANVAAETDFTFTSAADLSQTKDGISVVLGQGSNSQNAPVYNVSWNEDINPSDMRLYLGNTITVSAEEPLTNIQMVFAKSGASNKEYAGLSANTGTLVSGGVAEDNTDWKVDSWTGSATQVVFSLTGKGQRQIKRLLVNGEPIVITPPEELLPTAEDLQPEYSYPEPTVLGVPDTTIIKKEYAFIDHNILVHCNMGTIMKATDTTEAYFNCNAGYQLTFTAVKPIRGIEIDGFVKENFTASATSGHITHIDPPEKSGGEDGYPVFVITDVDATSVTISCERQIRCYAVRVFFEDTPDPIETAEPDTIDVVLSSAVAEDYSYDPDYSSEGSYSYWVKLISGSQDGYPQIWLDIYSAVQGDLSGSYSPYDYNVGSQTYVWLSDGETDGLTAYDMDITIEPTADGYHIEGILTCWERGYEYTDEGEDIIYRFTYDGPVPFEAPEGVETIQNTKLQSTKLLRNGILLIERNGKRYDVNGKIHLY